ncbi:MAG TPA: M28 family peptidase [Gaiellaceae bacterium]|nr:M28 family peptidase [Gaiellaceae bacterium]
MAGPQPAPERRRPRPGSLERPVNARLYRGTWLVIGFPLLLLAFSVARPAPLQPPNLPHAFDPTAAATLAADLAARWPSRLAGTPGAAGASRWFADQLKPYGYRVRRDTLTEAVPGRGRVRFVNLLATRPGRSLKTILVTAHRDDDGTGAGANDNASGTAALLELARAYAPAAGTSQVPLPYTLAFLSTDGAVDGGVGAAAFAAHAPEMSNVIAVLNLDAIAGRGRPRLVLTGDTPRSPTPGLVETVRARLAAESGHDPSRASALRQLIDLGFPFTRYEQAAFVSRGIPALTITTAPDRPQSGLHDEASGLRTARLGQIGWATQETIDALQEGIALAPGPPSYLYLGSRVVRGWAIELVLIGALLPFLAATIDLFARCRRRRIRIAPALRSYRSRLAFWLWCGVLFGLFGLAGAWSGGAAGRPPALTPVHWPSAALLGLTVLALVGWFVSRDRLLPRRPVRTEEVLAGHTGALLALGVVSLLVVATNPFALVFLLPSLHAWLWLPQVRAERPWARAAVLAAGFAGPALLLWSFAGRYGLGWDAPWYVLSLFANGYAPAAALVVALAWAAAAAQLVTLAAGRYAPYPAPAERRPRGPIRETVRRIVLAHRRRRASDLERRAFYG